MFGYRIGDPQEDLSFDTRDNAGSVPKSVVIDSAFTWGGDELLRTPWDKTIIYETHVRGFTAQHPAVPENLRGTYMGLTSPARSITSNRWASRPLNCCPSIISFPTNISWIAGSPTIGDTIPSGFLRRISGMPFPPRPRNMCGSLRPW